MKKTWIITGALGATLVVGGAAGLAHRQLPNSYDLSALKASHVARYFATTSQRNAYMVTASQLYT